MILFIEQFLNGLQYGVTLFLLAAGLTLIFGIMGVINLAHGSLYMVGAFAAAWVTASRPAVSGLACRSAWWSPPLIGLAMEATVIRRLYARDHLDQVLATFALILIFNQTVTLIFGRQPLFSQVPDLLSAARLRCCPACPIRPIGCS